LGSQSTQKKFWQTLSCRWLLKPELWGTLPTLKPIFLFTKVFMYTNVWVKYLPVLRIVLKRSLTAEQKLALNASDFVRAGYNRKSGYKFLIKLKDGRLNNVIVDMPVASSMASTLLGDESIKEIVKEEEFHISMNTKYEVTIKHIPQHKSSEETINAETV